MNDRRTVLANMHHGLEAFAAGLTATAYPVALRHSVGGKWLDLELELWRVMMETVKKGERKSPQTHQSA